MNYNKLYLTLVAVLFAVFAIVFDTFPRMRYSELEKRELKTFPPFTADSLWSGAFAEGISAWFSDSQPFRDDFMTFSMTFKDWAKLKLGDDNVTFHASTEGMEDFAEADVSVEGMAGDDGRTPEAYVNKLTANEKAKVSNAGIVVIGKGANVRALMCFGGSSKGGTPYAEVCNKYKRTFPDANVYCMIVPSAAAYYMPEKVKKMSRDQLPTIRNIYNQLDSAVQAVDIYTVLGEHAGEDIYLRTDHHWSPLGAYYAARKFAEVAEVPFHSLDEEGYYRPDTIRRFVGTMYAYSQDIAVKNAPEDFIYYLPLKAEYEATFQNYEIDENYQITSIGRAHVEPFFKTFRDGSSLAYSVFMGGDIKLTKVRTNVGNARRLLILKDSYGNALPGYLFYSFEEIHVVDGRYFTHNMKQYVRDNAITDILFANNIFQACGGRYRAYEHFLTMSEGSTDNPSTAFYKNRAKEEAEQDSVAVQSGDSAVAVPVSRSTVPQASAADTVASPAPEHASSQPADSAATAS